LKEDTMLEKTLGTWQIAGSDCTASLGFDWGRSVNISLQWSREPGPVQHEHLALILPDIVRTALSFLEDGAALCEGVLDAIAEGRMCRSGIEDELFTYEAVDRNQRSDGFPTEDDT
jgi:hypothetical protein